MGEIQKKEIKQFLKDKCSAFNTFRTLVLFGMNTATYKFAFCHALLKQKPQNSIRYDDLRDDFVKEFVDHFEHNPHQFQRGTTKFTQEIASYIKSEQKGTDWTRLIDVAEKSIYNNVFDAFQNVGRGVIDKPYQLFEHDRKNRKLILTDNTNLILENDLVIKEISLENQSRWNVVEEAWRAGVSPNLLEYNDQDKTFDSISSFKRVGLRSAINILIPYQKGRCFYCSRPLNRFANLQEDSFPDVDHFLPFSLLTDDVLQGANRNGVWNLVIACKSCNRGEGGKFNSLPHESYFKKLLYRNELFAEEHNHSLKNSILISLGITKKAYVKTKIEQLHCHFKILKGWKARDYF